MTYFQSLEEVREWVLLHEPDINTAYATMVAIKALWNDGYNEAFVDAAVPPGETPRPRGFIGEDAGDLSVATERLQEEPPDTPTDEPVGDYDEAPLDSEYRREAEAAFPDQTPDELGEYHNPLSNLAGPPFQAGDRLEVRLEYSDGEVRTTDVRRVTQTIDLPEGYKAILTLDPETERYHCGPVQIDRLPLDRAEAEARDNLLVSILRMLKRSMPLLVVAGCHREFVEWCDQHGYQWMSLYGKVFPYAKYIGRPEEIAGYDNREQRIRFIGNYRESDAFRGAAMFGLHDHIIGSSDPELRSHAEGDGHGDAAERYINRYGERVWEHLTGLRTTFEPFQFPDYVSRDIATSVEFRRKVLSNYARGIGWPPPHTQSPEEEPDENGFYSIT